VLPSVGEAINTANKLLVYSKTAATAVGVDALLKATTLILT